jgi:Fe2+ or Zn2+ uptake regulation protein
MNLEMDLSETGLEMFFKPYMVKSLDILWRNNKHLSSREIWEMVNEELEETISRASVINFLNAAVDLGLLDFKEITGKGGYRRIYKPRLSKPDTSEYLSNNVKDHLKTL